MSLKDTFARLGRIDGTLYLASRVLERLSGGRCRIVRYVLVAQPLGAAPAAALRPDAATQIRHVPVDDPAVAAFPRPAPVLQRRYRAGATCTAAWVKGVFAGFIWIQHAAYEEDEVRCTYVLTEPDTCVWDFDVYVEPRFRVGRTMGRLWAFVDAELAARGLRWSLSRISAFNAASLAAHARLGTVELGRASFLQLGSWQLAVLPHRPFVHVSAAGRAGPRLLLRPPPGT
jgi:hypothetical protein